MDLKTFFHSKVFVGIVTSVAAILVFSIIFSLGMAVGFHKARFSYQWGENYYRNFAEPSRGPMHDFGGRGMMNSHGLLGKVIKIEPGSLVIKDRENVEKVVLISDKTVITRFRETLKLSDLALDQDIVVIGSPDNLGNIEAKLIRVLPSPDSLKSTQ